METTSNRQVGNKKTKRLYRVIRLNNIFSSLFPWYNDYINNPDNHHDGIKPSRWYESFEHAIPTRPPDYAYLGADGRPVSTPIRYWRVEEVWCMYPCVSKDEVVSCVLCSNGNQSMRSWNMDWKITVYCSQSIKSWNMDWKITVYCNPFVV